MPHSMILVKVSLPTGSALYWRILRLVMMFSMTSFFISFSLTDWLHETAIMRQRLARKMLIVFMIVSVTPPKIRFFAGFLLTCLRCKQVYDVLPKIFSIYTTVHQNCKKLYGGAIIRAF